MYQKLFFSKRVKQHGERLGYWFYGSPLYEVPPELEQAFVDAWNNQDTAKRTEKQTADMKKGLHGCIKNYHKADVIPHHQVKTIHKNSSVTLCKLFVLFQSVMLAYIDKHEGGIMVDTLKLILFDAEKRLFIIQGLFPLDQNGCPLAEDKYADFYNLWVPKVAKEWKEAVSENRTQTNKVNLLQ